MVGLTTAVILISMQNFIGAPAHLKERAVAQSYEIEPDIDR